MGAFDAKYWNLSQAAAWVVYRRRDLVEAFEHQTDYGFASLKAYPMPDGAMAAPVGSIVELERALQEGRIKALGRRPSSPERVEVPADTWTDLSIRPPRAVRHDPVAGRLEPWQDLLFESAELRRLWRGLDEVAGRRKYDPEGIYKLYSEVRARLPDASQSRVIREVQEEFQERFEDRTPPSDSTLKDMIKSWRVAGRPV